MFVKICGITTADDAWAAVDAGADAVGFVLWEPSPRAIGPEEAAAIIRDLPPKVLTVAVFRDEAPARVLELFEATGARAVQIHGATPDEIEGLAARPEIPFVIEGVPGGSAAARVDRTPADLVLVDAAEPGSGRTFDWSSLQGLPRERLVLAGGLRPDSVAGAIREVQPFGVDVASGVEASPGRKDHDKVRRFTEEARAALTGAHLPRSG